VLILTKAEGKKEGREKGDCRCKLKLCKILLPLTNVTIELVGLYTVLNARAQLIVVAAEFLILYFKLGDAMTCVWQ